MKAVRQPSGLLRLMSDTGERIPNAPMFREICGAFGWPDLARQDHYSQTWLVIVGEQETGEHCVIAEFGGDLGHMAEKAIDWKDMLAIERIYLDGTDEDSTELLRRVDGLTHYEWSDLHEFTREPLYVKASNYWKHFRSRESIASLIPVKDRLRLNPRAGWDRLLQLNRNKKLVVLTECPRTEWLLHDKPTLKELLEHPLAKALIWCIGMMEMDRPIEDKQMDEPQYWYGNLR